MPAELPLRPRVLVVTTNFPLQRRGDVTGNFVVDPVLALADDVDQLVLAPLDTHLAAPSERLHGKVDVVRFRYWIPRRAQRLAYGDGIPTALKTSAAAWFQLPALLIALIFQVARHAKGRDVIHAHWLPLAVLSIPARLITGAKIIVTLHGTDVTQFPDRFVGWALRRVDLVISAHEDLLATATRLAPTTPQQRIRHHVAPQSPEPAAERELDALLEGAPLVLFVGRLSPERDPLSFIRAASLIHAERPNVRFALVGDGVLAGDCDIALADARLEHVVHRFGHRPDVWTFLRRASVFTAISDRNNAWVTAMVEAMVARVPVVATTAGDTARALTDGTDALLVPVADERAIADAILAVLDDDELAASLARGAAGTLANEGFTPDHVTSTTLAMYRTVGSLPADRR